jgi:hypothetical protein
MNIMKFEFTDKVSYLAWRAQWRADYKVLSQDIRAWKRTRKQYLNHYRRYMTQAGPVKELISREPNPFYGTCPNIGNAQKQATYLMELLTEAKALSWSLRQAAKAAAQVAA